MNLQWTADIVVVEEAVAWAVEVLVAVVSVAEEEDQEAEEVVAWDVEAAAVATEEVVAEATEEEAEKEPVAVWAA